MRVGELHAGLKVRSGAAARLSQGGTRTTGRLTKGKCKRKRKQNQRIASGSVADRWRKRRIGRGVLVLSRSIYSVGITVNTSAADAPSLFAATRHSCYGSRE